MKIIICLVIGAAVGAFGMKYHDDAKFAALTNAHIDSAVAQGAASAHAALQSAQSATK
jgi:hypothetical protein